ncbi:glycosyltransferase involved in cell wall biosynthesis [Croceifilum oryzae]|uniref:Glycosyltransferase involved in cell wall biosynthesis n=1 Tax=Croceifilum oryzae TaxID=1553429 RepID=A0AAJ1WS78_9BACL|nr:glycosyltransferase [Croceifilum oryzae]MDQ0417068.1 glycosyltransferase involved in cell wall biosynthesis [Croceifilum oryzae]
MSDHPPILTIHLVISEQINLDKLKNDCNEQSIAIKVYNAKDELHFNFKQPRVFFSVGSDPSLFPALCHLPLHERKRWLHFHSVEEITPQQAFYCWLRGTEPLPQNREIPPTTFSSETPLVSIFTVSYKSQKRILRPYESLLKQTYQNWEWVIVDDSDDQEDTYQQHLLSLKDSRVRRYRQDSHSGYIGAVKRYAAGLCTGEILVELDHDDELTPDALEKIVQALQRHPECGFVYGENAELHEDTYQPHWYGWDFSFGYGLYYRVWVHELGRWQNVCKNSSLNWTTIRHLVGLPNHPRAWTRDCYHLIGGHREELLVADDYDLLVRTFLCTKYLGIPGLLYLQYRNEGGNNSTFIRNRQIQILCGQLEQYYRPRINSRMEDIDAPCLEHVPYERIWNRPADSPALELAYVVDEDPNRVSLIFPFLSPCEGEDHTNLLKTLQNGMETNFKEFEVIIIGDIHPDVEFFASHAPSGAIRWWPMTSEESLESCIQYAKLCASCAKKTVILPKS